MHIRGEKVLLPRGCCRGFVCSPPASCSARPAGEDGQGDRKAFAVIARWGARTPGVLEAMLYPSCAGVSPFVATAEAPVQALAGSRDVPKLPPFPGTSGAPLPPALSSAAARRPGARLLMSRCSSPPACTQAPLRTDASPCLRMLFPLLFWRGSTHQKGWGRHKPALPPFPSLPSLFFVK